VAEQLCRRFGVQSLGVFRSAAGDTFGPRRSDIDFIVDFGPCMRPGLLARYFGLNEALSALFVRNMDLVMCGDMVKPYFIESVNRTRQPVYARTLTEAASGHPRCGGLHRRSDAAPHAGAAQGRPPGAPGRERNFELIGEAVKRLVHVDPHSAAPGCAGTVGAAAVTSRPDLLGR
jgi:hypothetical protein